MVSMEEDNKDLEEEQNDDIETSKTAALLVRQRRFKIITVLFLYILGYSIIVPLFPRLYIIAAEGDRAQASYVSGLVSGIGSVVQFLALPVLSALSDVFGKKSVLLLSLSFGCFLYLFLMASIDSLLSVSLANVLSGLTFVNIPVCNAALAETTRPGESAAHAFGLVTAAFGLCLVVGPLLGSYLGDRNPHYACAAGLVPTLLAVAFLLLCDWGGAAQAAAAAAAAAAGDRPPATPPPPRRLTRAASRRILADGLRPWRALGLFCASPAFAALGAQFFCFDLAAGLLNTLYIALDYRYGWTPEEVGVYVAVFGLLTCLVQTAGLRALVGPGRRLGEGRAMGAALGCQAAGFLAQAAAGAGWGFYAALPVAAGALLFEPCALGRLAALARRRGRGQGAAQGAAQALRTATQVVSGPLYGAVFRAATGWAEARGLGRWGAAAPPLAAAAASLAGLGAWALRGPGGDEGEGEGEGGGKEAGEDDGGRLEEPLLRKGAGEDDGGRLEEPLLQKGAGEGGEEGAEGPAAGAAAVAPRG